MTDIDNGQVLRQLVQLQRLHAKISQLRARVDECPKRMSELDAQLSGHGEAAENAKLTIETATKERRALERDVETLKAKLSHYKDKLMDVKTNTEYQAMLHEISYVETQIRAKEDQILERMVEADDLEAGLKVAHREFEEKQREIEQQKKELEEFVNSSEEELANFRHELEQLESSIPVEFLERFKRISAARGGVAVAMVQDQTCEACHVRLRPQMLVELKENKEIILCENCNRILCHPASV